MTTGLLVVEFRQTTRATSSGAGYLRLYRFPGGGKDAVRKQACGTLVATFAPECVRGNIECHVSCVMCHVSCVMCHVSCVMCHVSCVMCHVSCVMCHVSCVMCHVSC